METANKLQPFRSVLSLTPLIDFWKTHLTGKCSHMADMFDAIFQRIEQTPTLQGTIEDPNVLVALGDRMEMAHSIEGRLPFLDHHVVEVIVSQPVNQKIRGMTEKFVLREAVRDVITDTVYNRQKSINHGSINQLRKS